MAKSTTTIAPRVDALVLPELAAGYPSEVEPGAHLDALRFDGLDISGLDLTGVSFSECELRDVEAHEASLRGGALVDTRIERLNAPVLGASRSRLREVHVIGSRLGSVEFFDANWQSVRFTGCKIGYLNLRSATLRDVIFEDCQIDELDLGDAQLTRVAFEDTAIGMLEVARARHQDVDFRGAQLRGLGGAEGLRGATMNEYQLAELAPIFAAIWGIRVEN